MTFIAFLILTLLSTFVVPLDLIKQDNGLFNVTCDLSLKKCLPSFIISGFQKSGTTALAAYLSEHSSIYFPARKEIHYFDKTSRYNKGLEEYLKPFPVWTKKTSSALTVPLHTTYAEATPFYLASRVSSERIAKSLPSVKLVAIYRDPIERAYSEYQMKLRRVQEQHEFFALAVKHEKQLHKCMTELPSDLDGVKKCVPKELSSHPRWSKLKNAFKKTVEEGVKRLRKTCSEESDLEEREVLCQDEDEEQREAAQTAVGWSLVLQSCFTRKTDRQPDGVGGGSNRSMLATTVHNKTESTSTSLISSSSSVISVSGSASDFMTQRGSEYYQIRPSQPSGVKGPLSSSIFHFDAPSCFQYSKEGYEAIKPLGEAFQGEIEAFQECGGERLRDIVERSSGSWDGMAKEEFTSMMDVLDGIVDKCLTVRTGISTQYFYRSLYAVQLHHCFKHIPQERVILVSAESLRASPLSTVNSVLSFVGLPPFNSSSGKRLFGPAAEEVGSTVKKHFPAFEKNTGWRLKSEYDPLPEDLRQYLELFFAPFERMFDYLLTHNE